MGISEQPAGLLPALQSRIEPGQVARTANPVPAGADGERPPVRSRRGQHGHRADGLEPDAGFGQPAGTGRCAARATRVPSAAGQTETCAELRARKHLPTSRPGRSGASPATTAPMRGAVGVQVGENPDRPGRGRYAPGYPARPARAQSGGSADPARGRVRPRRGRRRPRRRPRSSRAAAPAPTARRALPTPACSRHGDAGTTATMRRAGGAAVGCALSATNGAHRPTASSPGRPGLGAGAAGRGPGATRPDTSPGTPSLTPGGWPVTSSVRSSVRSSGTSPSSSPTTPSPRAIDQPSRNPRARSVRGKSSTNAQNRGPCPGTSRWASSCTST